ncbi:hypothetical protein [Scleromatobacter humisilvae]|uniref:Uncharacterized protein n=1 Tax=Scleromatobacter humisilvae TaxID=2897159 RepID=A0A9X1YJ64_9BURK|nr:hypothetical protein [Scleromatobacter humisilvae]MCK9685723.1 hypothetical protein [Scleromatobacter humisilvae]
MTAQEAYESIPVGGSRMIVRSAQQTYEQFNAFVRELEDFKDRGLLRLTRGEPESMTGQRHVDKVRLDRLE